MSIEEDADSLSPERSSTSLKISEANQNIHEEEDDGEPDEWDKRIIKTGCAKENFDLQICYADNRDWRKCTKEMEIFKNCWKNHNNNERTKTKNY